MTAFEIDLLRQGAHALGLTLSDQAIDRLSTYRRLLMEWNQKLNLTAVMNPEDIIVRHFLDSLAGIPPALPNAQGMQWLDVGTGAGFPGLVVKIWDPTIEMTLLDSVAKKLRFCEFVCRELGLEGVTQIHARSEQWGREQGMSRYDRILARAVAPLPRLLKQSSSLLAPGGRLLAWKGPNWEQEWGPTSMKEAKRWKLSDPEPFPYQLPGLHQRFVLRFQRAEVL